MRVCTVILGLPMLVLYIALPRMRTLPGDDGDVVQARDPSRIGVYGG